MSSILEQQSIKRRAAMCENVHKVVLIEDDLVSQKQIVDAFRKAPRYNVHAVSSVREALKKITSDSVDFVLMNACLGAGESNGFGFARALRENGYEGYLYLFNASPSPSLLFQALLAGADSYIPVNSLRNFVREMERTICVDRDVEETENGDSYASAIIESSGFLRSAGLCPSEIHLLSSYVKNNYPRIKEFSVLLNISETSLWKRLARIRAKLHLDNMSQIAHLLTSLSLLENRRRTTLPCRQKDKTRAFRFRF